MADALKPALVAAVAVSTVQVGAETFAPGTPLPPLSEEDFKFLEGHGAARRAKPRVAVEKASAPKAPAPGGDGPKPAEGGNAADVDDDDDGDSDAELKAAAQAAKDASARK